MNSKATNSSPTYIRYDLWYVSWCILYITYVQWMSQNDPTNPILKDSPPFWMVVKKFGHLYQKSCSQTLREVPLRRAGSTCAPWQWSCNFSLCNMRTTSIPWVFLESRISGGEKWFNENALILNTLLGWIWNAHVTCQFESIYLWKARFTFSSQSIWTTSPMCRVACTLAVKRSRLLCPELPQEKTLHEVTSQSKSHGKSTQAYREQ